MVGMTVEAVTTLNHAHLPAAIPVAPGHRNLVSRKGMEYGRRRQLSLLQLW